MNKTAETTYPIHDLLANRWSPRAFSGESLSKETVGSLLEAARWAASAFNAQPWRFIVATPDDAPEFEKMLACLGEFNQMWAKNASVLMVAVAQNNFEYNGKPNGHAAHDLGQALATLTVQAAAEGLYVHQMAGFSPDKARETYNIPADHVAKTMLVVGKLGDINDLSGPLREREMAPRSRKPLSELVFSGEWGNAAGY